ncbi:hypothetical protein [Gaetbulibacter aestuarii]|uniref:OmpA family protein n=2 Tax=Gaetbulibacter aestuarii TaxID=1502358 RepID=A0ABW7MVL6_9FLAO
MNLKHLFLALCAYLFFQFSHAQNTYDIVFPNNGKSQKCNKFSRLFQQKPEEVKFSIKRVGNKLYFEINDNRWFNELFENPYDGLAIDVVAKSRYDCSLTDISNDQVRGTVLPPVYYYALKNSMRSVGNGRYQIYVGDVPNNLLYSELEYNILFLSNKNMCRYYVIYNLENYGMDLLDMGMYLDDVSYNTKKVTPIDDPNYATTEETLKFIIPFKKNKSTYSQADIKPVYDSLKLGYYNIKKIDIKSYSSIEGISSRNIELQKLRAQSVIEALQSFQTPTIKTTISASENWVEFFNDIKGTKYAYLGNLSKEGVRKAIAGNISREMEPILKNHRKAVLELEIEKKTKYTSESEGELIANFNAALSAGQLGKANDIQNSIFEKLRGKSNVSETLDKMSIPYNKAYVDLLVKNAGYRYLSDFSEAMIVLDQLEQLEKLDPQNPKIQYDLAAVRLKLLYYNAIKMDERDLQNEITDLKDYNIEKSLIDRMLVNLQMVIAEKLMKFRDFSNKDKSVDFVRKNYKEFNLSNYDYLSLAEFFSNYGTRDMAIDLLKEKANKIDIDENLLFYYLNLTLFDKDITSEENYRSIMLNAININKQRFCKLFNSVDEGGVTFQLLEDPFLRKTYCESCANQIE